MQPASGARAWAISYAPGTQLCVSLGTVRSRQGWEVGEQAGPGKQEGSGSQEAVRVRGPSRGAHHICLALRAGCHSQRLLSPLRSLLCTGRLSCWVSVRAPRLSDWRGGEGHGTAGAGHPLPLREVRGPREGERGLGFSRRKGQTSFFPSACLSLSHIKLFSL